MFTSLNMLNELLKLMGTHKSIAKVDWRIGHQHFQL